MIHDTVSLRGDLNKWLPVFKASLGLSQNQFARGAGIDPSIFSRWYRGYITSSIAADRSAKHLARMKRRVVARERAS
jgi:transcriptional regulator with XRE-family HTH domain